eukprot:m.398574 g.398574  ORF g.398574 m.398574 type:complete len:170 (+) comp21137_c0_seq1:704-1213(+)
MMACIVQFDRSLTGGSSSSYDERNGESPSVVFGSAPAHPPSTRNSTSGPLDTTACASPTFHSGNLSPAASGTMTPTMADFPTGAQMSPRSSFALPLQGLSQMPSQPKHNIAHDEINIEGIRLSKGPTQIVADGQRFVAELEDFKKIEVLGRGTHGQVGYLLLPFLECCF